MCGWSIKSAIRLDTGVLMAESALVTVLGGLAAALTSLSYLPKVKKGMPRGSTEHLSWKMLSHLWACEGRLSHCGLQTGVGERSRVFVLVCKIRDTMSKGATSPMARRIGG